MQYLSVCQLQFLIKTFFHHEYQQDHKLVDHDHILYSLAVGCHPFCALHSEMMSKVQRSSTCLLEALDTTSTMRFRSPDISQSAPREQVKHRIFTTSLQLLLWQWVHQAGQRQRPALFLLAGRRHAHECCRSGLRGLPDICCRTVVRYLVRPLSLVTMSASPYSRCCLKESGG